jgi:hypothetical protein
LLDVKVTKPVGVRFGPMSTSRTVAVQVVVSRTGKGAGRQETVVVVFLLHTTGLSVESSLGLQKLFPGYGPVVTWFWQSRVGSVWSTTVGP